jgi:protoporphyrinogen oxidase
MSLDLPTVAILGGGILGLTLGYRLSSAGVPVVIYERDPIPGGLAGAMDFAGLQVDRFYHVILPTDTQVIDLCQEVGVADRLQFRPTRVGYFDQGKMYSLSSLAEFLRFTPLSWYERMRLAYFVLYCQRVTDWPALDDMPLEDWLLKQCGSGLFKKLWLPLLHSKFDDQPEGLPATYLWARTRRMSTTRDRSQRERMGCLVGGYQVLAEALVKAIREKGGQVHLGVGVQELACRGGKVVGLETERGHQSCRAVVSTLLPCHLQPLLPAESVLEPQRYLGIVCLLLKLRQSLSPYYSINITDRSIPFTTVVETTHVIGPENMGGQTLVYVPKYVKPESPYFNKPDRAIAEEFFPHMQRMFPEFNPKQILDWQVMRARTVEPVHGIGAGRQILPITSPMPGLFQTSTAQIYPALVNCQAVIQLATRVASELMPQVQPLATRR